MTLSTGAAYLKRGYRRDPEDWRMTHRLEVARSILRSQGIETEAIHMGGGRFERGMVVGRRQIDLSTMSQAERDEHRSRCGDGIGCREVWPEDITDEVFQAAFDLANAIQNARSARTAQAVNERARRA